MESIPSRVVGSPQAGRLFGAKSREALTEREHRRSGHYALPPAPASPPLPQVIYVPLPSPPRAPHHDAWQDEYMQRARVQCGLPVQSPGVERAEPWPGTAPTLPRSVETDTSNSTGTTASADATPPPIAWPVRESFWKRVCRAIGCLGGR